MIMLWCLVFVCLLTYTAGPKQCLDLQLNYPENYKVWTVQVLNIISLLWDRFSKCGTAHMNWVCLCVTTGTTVCKLMARHKMTSVWEWITHSPENRTRIKHSICNVSIHSVKIWGYFNRDCQNYWPVKWCLFFLGHPVFRQPFISEHDFNCEWKTLQCTTVHFKTDRTDDRGTTEGWGSGDVGGWVQPGEPDSSGPLAL